MSKIKTIEQIKKETLEDIAQTLNYKNWNEVVRDETREDVLIVDTEIVEEAVELAIQKTASIIITEIEADRNAEGRLWGSDKFFENFSKKWLYKSIEEENETKN